MTALAGCSPINRFRAWRSDKDLSYYQDYATKIEYPDVRTNTLPEIAHVQMPLTINDPSELPTWDMSLNEAVRSALSSSELMRSLGGNIVLGPQGTASVFDSALTESNPQGGVDAALSAFDAQVAGQLFWQKNNRANNNAGFVLFPSSVEQTTGNYVSSITKTTATGARFAFRHNVVYDRNNSPFRLFQSDFNGFFEAEYRQPLMQGRGSLYNRIAGPTQIPGQYNGVLIARINGDVSLADFEQGVIGLINDVETAYWELYFAYRSLEAQVNGRANALQTWQRVNELQRVGVRGGEADAEAQSRSQFYQFSTQVNDALSGPNGLYAAEQRLRYLMGMPPSDGRLIRPSELPTQAEVVYDWDQAVSDALCTRVEIRRQKWQIKRRELELCAARLNRRPRLDMLSQYRWRGLGDHLIDNRDAVNQFNSLYQNIFEGNYQEWQTGMELTYPVGFRQASAAVRFAQLNLAREMAVLKEQELRVTHDLSSSARQVSRSYIQVQANYNLVEALRLQVEVLRNRYEGGLININFLLQAQQQLAASESNYHRALADYALSLRDLHRQKGSLLAYNQVQLSEAGWSGDAYQDAYQRGRAFRPSEVAPFTPNPISDGPFDPSMVGMGAAQGMPEGSPSDMVDTANQP